MMSATVAGTVLKNSFRPTRSYTNPRDVTVTPEFAGQG
jgi:hypothetical protein